MEDKLRITLDKISDLEKEQSKINKQICELNNKKLNCYKRNVRKI